MSEYGIENMKEEISMVTYNSTDTKTTMKGIEDDMMVSMAERTTDAQMQAHGGAGEPRAWEPVHFLETRFYLQRVRDQKRRIELLEGRIQYRKNAGLTIDYLEEELLENQNELATMIAEVAEEISKLKDVNQESVFIKRYIDILPWDEVATSLDFKMRTVQKCHGNGLPKMEKILIADGLIEINDGDEDVEV